MHRERERERERETKTERQKDPFNDPLSSLFLYSLFTDRRRSVDLGGGKKRHILEEKGEEKEKRKRVKGIESRKGDETSLKERKKEMGHHVDTHTHTQMVGSSLHRLNTSSPFLSHRSTDEWITGFIFSVPPPLIHSISE
mmetsp:Transcript_30794/g.60633  ORF Transcript_30794/g.60633 Transcript_30794/m.60633 type:complete len:140 (+) Transcript_30794:695-1114(+)